MYILSALFALWFCCCLFLNASLVFICPFISVCLCSMCTSISDAHGQLCKYFYLCYWSTLYALLSLLLVRSVYTFISGWMLTYSLLNFAKLKKTTKSWKMRIQRGRTKAVYIPTRLYPSKDLLPLHKVNKLPDTSFWQASFKVFNGTYYNEKGFSLYQ